MDEQLRFDSSNVAPDARGDVPIELSDEQLEHVVGGLARAWYDELPPVSKVAPYDAFTI